MADVRAGDIRQFTIKGREFDPAKESSFNVLAGGYSNEHGLTGNGKNHITAKRKAAGISDASVSVSDGRKDLEFLQAIQDSGEAVPVTLTLISGTAYSGSLVLCGEDLGKSTGEGVAGFSLLGEKFEQI